MADSLVVVFEELAKIIFSQVSTATTFPRAFFDRLKLRVELPPSFFVAGTFRLSSRAKFYFAAIGEFPCSFADSFKFRMGHSPSFS
jgi:hypothetical protein